MPAAKPGEAYDLNRYPIYPGDVCRSFHFTDYRGKKQYLFHVATLRDGYIEMVPCTKLDTSMPTIGGNCWLFQDLADHMEIVQCGEPYWDERIRKPKPAAKTA